jgi:CCR4-NOT transcription complex subunit 1
MSAEEFDRVSNAPWRSEDAPYITVDALAKLVAFMVIFQAPGADGEVNVKPAKSLEAILRLVILVMNDHHNKQRDRWNGRVYFRLFSTLLCELHSARQHLGAHHEQEIAQVFAIALQVMQPKHFSGFSYHWLALLSHRLFVPSLLGGMGRTNNGWDTFTKLLHILFTTLGEFLEMPDGGAVMQDFYRGTTRFLLMLHHDYSEYLIENHTQLNSSIPLHCFQLHNIVNSAVTRAVINDQPDPFTAGLKINRLDQVRQPPAVFVNLDKILEEAGIKEAVQRSCTGNELTSEELDTILSTLEHVQHVAKSLLSNTIALYIAVNATTASSVFSAAALPARLLERLLKDSSDELRYNLVSAMVNQVRYINAHTHYFSGAVQHFFGSGTEDLQQTIMRVLAERLGVPRPHPWGLIVMVLELLKDPALNIFELPWMKTAPQVESMLVSLAQSSERLPRSPLGPMGM